MPAVHTHQQHTSTTGELPKLRAPLRALQMLTQSVSSREYVQPISDGNEHQKKSPLALLAATCSSIGKTETSKQEGRSGNSPKITSSTTSSPDAATRGKSADDNKSSFKPYLNDDKDSSKANNGQSGSNDKPGFRAPSKELSSSESSKSPDFRSKMPHYGGSFQYPYYASADPHCFYPANRLCGMYFDLAHPSPHHQTCLKTDCNCGSVLPPTSIPTTPTSTPRAIFPSTSQPSLVKGHGSTSSRSNPLYPRCNCGYCNQTLPGETTPPSLKGASHSNFAGTYSHRDYTHSAAICQDPYCTNCKSHASSSPRGCGPHCYHQHDGVFPSAMAALSPSVSHMYPYGFMLRAQSDQPSQFVCNWVQDSKNCGKNFPTSDELLQHLRTHTNSSAAAAAATAVAPPIHTPCNIPGCPCGLKSSGAASASRAHSSRYHPYFLPSPSALHSSAYHSAISPYVSPHAMPYTSPFKPY